MNKIVIFRNAILRPGGGERLTFEESKYLSKKGYQVKILTFETIPEALYNYLDKVDLEVIRAGGSFLSRLFKLRKRLKEIKPDLIIAQSAGDAHLLYLTGLNIPYITHIHGSIFWFEGELSKYCFIFKKSFKKIRNSLIGHREFIPAKMPRISLAKRIFWEIRALLNYLAVRKSAQIIVLTEQNKWEVHKLYGREGVIARGCLNPEVFNYQPKQDIREKYHLQNKKIILNIGRLDPRKRIDLLIRCFGQLSKKYENLVLMLGGIGPQEQKLKDLVGSLNLNDRVIFVGYINDDNLYDYYAVCDVFAFPSWTSSGITTYEALVLQKNVVWTSEAEEPVLNHPHIFLAEPTLKDFTRGLEKALLTEVSERIDLTQLTWDDYFSVVEKEIKKIIKQP